MCEEPVRGSVFPGIVLLYDHRPCAAVGYTPDPTGTVVLSQPVVLLDASDEVYRALCDQLFRQVKLKTTADGFRSLQFLQDESTEGNNTGRTLAAQGFVQAAEILQWERTAELSRSNQLVSSETDFRGLWSDKEPDSLNRLEFAPAVSVSTRILQQALGRILQCSDDLTALPRPTAADLLTKWQQTKASVFVCRVGRDIAGIMACATASAKSSSSQSVSETQVCIEYIGVVPVFRKQHVASRLISRIPKLLNVIPEPGESASLMVRAFSDATNSSATHLYQRCGFDQTERLYLWHCDLQLSRTDSGG
ncbi:MAG TPA: hypothetical protein PLR25_19420 [Planctomycetaceae bacterium]|nr:hypothetical protein [Planctomycetaceae bacterium]